MRTTIVIITSLLVVWSNSFGQSKPDNFIQKGTVSLTVPYSQLDTTTQWFYDSTNYEIVRNQNKFECLKGIYGSDNVSVEVWIYKPIYSSNTKYPLIIYNRGGTGNFGSLTEVDLVNFYKLASSGYVIMASQYRYIGSNGKYDELGGSDVNDITNLKSIYQSLPYVDTHNVYMFGVSRGGQMAYQASKVMDLNAMAIIGGVADFKIQSENRNEFIDGWVSEPDPKEDFLGLKNNLPEFFTRKEYYLNQRSATMWADSINIPVLILHSRRDSRVSCDQALNLALQLQKFKKDYSILVYDEPSHTLPFKYFDSYDRIISWFEAHRKRDK